MNELIRGGALLNPLLTNREELLEKVKVKDSLGCKDRETWQVPRVHRPGGKRGPGEQVGLQGQPPQNMGSLLQYAESKASIAGHQYG